MLSTMQRIGGKAFSKVQDIFKSNTDPDLDFYEKLGDNEFENIRTKYGPGTTVDYITEMERRRMLKGVSNGNR